MSVTRLSLIGLLTPGDDWDGVDADAAPCTCGHTLIAHREYYPVERSADCMGWTFDSGSWKPDCECKAFELKA